MTTTRSSALRAVAATIGELDPERGLLVGGAGRAAAGGRCLDVEDPASGALLACVPDGGAADATAAVDAAAAAFPDWADTAPRARSEVLHGAFELMRERSADLADLIAAENGKAVADARAEVSYAAEFLRWFAEEAVRADGGYSVAPAGGTRTIVTSRPVGVAALVTPWNFPAAMVTRKIGPALAAGCTAVLKPAAETPLTALALVHILAEAGLPPGVLNLVPTSEPDAVVGAWLRDPRVRKISFTGSTGVGQLLLRQAADRMLSSSMELGGNAPFVVAAGADLDAAARGAMIAKFRNGGQACTAANRFYVHASVADAFVERLGAAITALRVGHAFEAGTDIGPLISPRAVKNLTGLVDDALARGARISHQASPGPSSGSFFTPTLLVDVPDDATILRTEAFGPVVPVATWTDEDEVLHRVNDTEYGLASYVYAGDLGWALRFAERVEAGMVAINRGLVSDPSAPFGGLKQSGLGREGAREGLRAFTETQYFSLDWT